MRYTVKVNEHGIFWYKEGTNIYHREHGPACEYADGDKHWYLNGKLHREDGPAIEYANGTKVWYLDNVNYTEENYKKELAKRNGTCNDKIVEIDGKKYKLISVEE